MPVSEGWSACWLCKEHDRHSARVLSSSARRDLIALDFVAALGKFYFPANAALKLTLNFTAQLNR